MLFVIYSLCCGAWGLYSADQKGRNVPIWAFFCALTGLAGVLVLSLLPMTRKRKADIDFSWLLKEGKPR